jgi:hypothetical protein
MTITLGQNLFVTGWTVETTLTPHEVEGTLQHLVELIQMDTGGMPCQVHSFPLHGKGGIGITAFQPLVESFSIGVQPVGAAIGDTWDDCGHIFFVIASCKPYSRDLVADWFETHSWHVISSGSFDLYGRGGVFKGGEK